jgi:ABC-type Zn uptake system ZnuABC Zn-binding protein ZnuA
VQKKGAKRSRKKDRAKAPATASDTQPTSAAGTNPSALDTLKQNLSGKRKAIFEILEDVKKVKPEQWQDPNHVETMAKNFADKLGLPVPEQRIKQFVNAYKDATKNGQPSANVDELVKKYGQNIDDKTLKEIKKFVPKTK